MIKKLKSGISKARVNEEAISDIKNKKRRMEIVERMKADKKKEKFIERTKKKKIVAEHGEDAV